MAKANTQKPPKEIPGASDKSPDLPEGAKPGDEPPAPGAPDPGAPDPGAPNPPPADQDKPKAASHVCLEPVKHKGKRHQPGDPIELTEAEAEPLLAQQAIQKA